MLLRYISVLHDAPAAFVILVGAFIFSMLVGLAFHEFSHALIADGLGDPTPRRAGRLTLDPRAHLDPVGSLMILFVGFGWARPTPVNPYCTANPKRTMTLVAAAGPVSNLVLAGLAGIPIKLGLVPFFHPFIYPGLAAVAAQVWTASPANLFGLFLGTVLLLNVILAVFNFLPLAPLDGFRVAVGLLPDSIAVPLARMEAWGPGLLLVLFLMPMLSAGRFTPLQTVMAPALAFFVTLFAGDAGGLRFG